ncbi:hypothetical protein A3K29_05105 [Candidatus Collierbacteria bacterium RIFOXYB2_FULL_46_14]|nr:MAG: hypothetical protein A3K29_05105 [Candidatus Collierbacteria bacterium RIFOXYB2_FULL_46_14]OGD76515.1 MAG: hypothetical protein A3K43_05105 [Candidatus Collierbacteria bacterium RIFOXYA2_FULL_46_20]OGD77851.1 MAG: hypothetical protein A3K39_05105 [Candidatus Collierbacteria bacterium RIFOXYC2_FULL_43_15]OGD81142.1 MAG: hypothetical protein A2320_05605 [Pseudomonadales bacterium GWC2_63_15]OGD82573.1 MAG: hypothetical protein A3K36_05105 [Candidatus Collierbacteria bacterium RIFOXYD2_FUL
MTSGQSGYVAEYAVFKAEGMIMLVGSAKITTEISRYQTVRITKRNDIYEVDSQTIASWDIYEGWPQAKEDTDYLLAKLV